MKKYQLLIIVMFSSIFLTGCYEKYDRTIPVCEGKLFVERYHHNFIDVGYYYLTDSTNFRLDVGKFDNEHGGYSIICNNDSITISERYEGEVINIRKYSLANLRKEGY